MSLFEHGFSINLYPFVQLLRYKVCYTKQHLRRAIMSKEATGKNGAVLGSSEYWYYVNHATIFDRVMRNTSDIN